MPDKNDILNLIKSVENHSKLYINLTRNDEDVIDEWSLVAKECGMSITAAQDQWNILMNGYLAYLRNNQDFSFAQYMDFLQPYFFTINNKENIDEMELLNAIDSKDFEETNLPYEEYTGNNETKLETYFESQSQIKYEEAQKTRAQNSTLCEKSEPKTDCISSTAPQDNSVTNMSSLELIFLGYAKQLQKMPLSLQLSTKRKIADIMDEAELQMVNL